MNHIDDTLWVIKFNSNPFSPEGRPSITFSEQIKVSREEHRMEDIASSKLSDETALQFLDHMQRFFKQIVESTKANEPMEPDLKMDELTKSLEDLNEWMKKFQKFLNNPDDLTGKDPH